MPRRPAPGRPGPRASRRRGGLGPGPGARRDHLARGVRRRRAGAAVRPAPRRAQPRVPGRLGYPPRAEPGLRRDRAGHAARAGGRLRGRRAAQDPKGALGDPRAGFPHGNGCNKNCSLEGGVVMSAVRYPVVELRQYTLRPGQRDVLIDLFDRELVESQEAEGMAIVGQFRDLDDPDRFVWIRGFGDMPARARALAAFYGGPAWKAHSAEANATMIDSDNVLLLRPVTARSGFPAPASARPPAARPPAGHAPAGEAPATHVTAVPSRVLVTLYHRDRP